MPARGIGEKCYPGYRAEVLFSGDVTFDMWTNTKVTGLMSASERTRNTIRDEAHRTQYVIQYNKHNT